MLIRKEMGFRTVVCFLAFVLLFTLAVADSEIHKEVLLGNLIDSGVINEDTAELLWINCGLELILAKDAVEDIESHLFEEKLPATDETISSKRLSLIYRRNLRRAVTALHPEISQTLVDCLKKKNLMFLVSGEDKGSKNWYTKYLNFWFLGSDAPKRRELVENSAAAPAPAPSPEITPISTPSPIPNPAPNPPPVRPFFPRDFNDSSLPPSGSRHSSTSRDSASNVQSDRQNSRRGTIIVSVVVTAIVTFVIAALLFLCYRRGCCSGSGIGRNDERPLLSLSLSEYSTGSSHKPFAQGNSINKVNPGNMSFHTNSSHHKMGSSVNGNFSVESNFVNISRVEAAVGAVSTSGLPPLKPPPGREGGRGNAASSPPLPPAPSPPPPPPPSSSVRPSGGPQPPPPPPSMKPSGGPQPPPPRAPPPPPMPSGPRPPPPPSGLLPPRPPAMGLRPPRPPGAPNAASAGVSEADAPKAKLKPFFWDKVLANPDHSMVWHQIKSGSFQFNEEMIETLFGTSAEKNKNEPRKESSSQDPSTQYVRIIDLKKAQNLAILLKALNVTTEEVCDALQEGNELPSELLQTLLKMAPTADEELKLRLYSGELSRLGLAERFLKVLVDIPFAFKRMESLLFISTLQEETTTSKESFATLEAACTELRKSRLFFKLLEAVLKTGNRMNDGTFRGGAQAFKLDTLLKLADVKGTDGKTTLLHFVVQEIIRSEGVRAARAAGESPSTSTDENQSRDSEDHYRIIGLQVVSGLSGELENVKKAAALDADSITGSVSKLGHALIKTRDFLNSDIKNLDEENGFRKTLKNFVQNAEVDIMWILEEEKRIMALVKSTADYFHGNSGKDEGLRLFTIVRDFLIMLDKACQEVKAAPKKPNRTAAAAAKKEEEDKTDRNRPTDPRQRLFPAIRDRRMDSSSSDEEDSS